MHTRLLARSTITVGLVLFTAGLVLFTAGCSTFGKTPLDSPPTPPKIVVGPVFLEAPVTKTSEIRSSDEELPQEDEQALLSRLIEGIETNAQRLLTEALSNQRGFTVIPFEEARRLHADLVAPHTLLTDAQIRELGRRAGADIVIAGLIHDYGAVRWQYWVTGWLAHVSFATTIVGAATAWNPAAIGTYLAIDATTDFPLWWGGGSVFGWTFRPVRLHADATQLVNCEGLIWTQEELAIKVPGKTLAEYPEELRDRKETHLEANLKRATGDIAEAAGEKLSLQACDEDGKPEQISTFSILSILDLLY
jgi:hypothetical protein